MKDNKKVELAQWASQYAKENGAKEVSVSVYDSKESEVEVRKQKIEKIQESIQSGLSLKLYVNGKYSTHSTNRLDRNDLEKFIKEAILGTNYLAEDQYRSLPDRHLCYDGTEKDLKLFDSRYDSIDPRQKIDLAMQVEAETTGMDERIISVSGSYNDGFYRSYLVLSNGVEGFKESTSYSVSASASINGGDEDVSQSEDNIEERTRSDRNLSDAAELITDVERNYSGSPNDIDAVVSAMIFETDALLFHL